MSQFNYGDDEGLFAIAAFRYCLGGSSYIVDAFCDFVVRNAARFHAKDRKLMVREISEAIAAGCAGHPLFVCSWKRAKAGLCEITDELDPAGYLEMVRQTMGGKDARDPIQS
jgi:hypothetical protein